MDAEVEDVEETNSGGVVRVTELGKGERTNSKNGVLYQETSNKDDHGVKKPHVGMEFDSEDAAKNFYASYARHIGFSTRDSQYSHSQPDGPLVCCDFACSRELFKRKNGESCNAMLRIERRDASSWVVTKFVDDHNHSICSQNKLHHLRPHKRYAGGSKTMLEKFDTTDDVYVSVDGNHIFYEPSCGCRSASPVEPHHPFKSIGQTQYARSHKQRRTLGRDAQNLLNYFKRMQAENLGFFYAIQLDDENRMTNVFWADARSRAAYKHFGDAVVFDTTYRPNMYRVPFAPFTGINHHGQIVLFGCALILDESVASFVWLLKTWQSAMNDIPPVSITTDQDRAIQAAVAQLFPRTRHCICKWHILREGQERLAHIYLAHPSFYNELYNCINFSETSDDFESTWDSLLDKYNLRKNEWLQAVYNARRQWSPVFFRDSFFAVISSNQEVKAFFDGYVNQQTTLPLFFKQYERALEDSLEREIEADYETIHTNPILKTPSPMELKAADQYTRKVFTKFQEELVETFAYTANKFEGDGMISKYRVAKYENDHRTYVVTLDVSEMEANCSCLMFEYAGILCRHVLTVFTVTNVLDLPSHYILKRWTKGAKTAVTLDEHHPSADHLLIENLTSRFAYLCKEATKFAEEGSVALETYNAALSVLREGTKKITILKKTTVKVTPGAQDTLENQGKSDKKRFWPMSEHTTPSLWPWQETTPYCFNLNDAGVAIADLNQESMSPVSLLHDGIPLGDTVVFTCFKSMTWVIENNSSSPLTSKVAVIGLKLQDYEKPTPGDSVVQFRLTKATLEPMLRSMTCISQQLSLPANRVAVINLKLQDARTTSGNTEVKFQVSRDTLASMLRSMMLIREQL